MEDPALNRNIDEVRELQTRWGQFHDFFTMALKGGSITAEAERAFLDLKTRICMLHDSFVSSLKHDFKVGQQVLTLLGQCILLRRLPLMNNAEVQKIELEWNEAYMLMNETIAGLEEERQRLANINERTYKLNKYRELLVAKLHNGLMSGWFLLIFFGVVIPGFIIFGVPAFGIYEWGNIKRDVKFLRPVQLSLEDGWRKYFNSDLPYDEIERIPVNVVDAKNNAPHREDANRAKQLTPDFLISQLINIGFSKGDFPKARDLLEKRIGFSKEARQHIYNRKSMVMFGILFKSTVDAKDFIEMRRKGLATYEKPIQTRVNSTVWVGRIANYVVLTISEEENMREIYPTQKFNFEKENIAL